MMKNIELINESIQKLANKPSEEAIAAAQSIAKEMDDALASGNGIKWSRWPIENSKSFEVVNAAIIPPKIVCNICDENILEVHEIFYGIDLNKDELGLYRKLLDLVLSWP